MSEKLHIVEGDNRLIPAPTAAENGKVLKVVNGVSTWSTGGSGGTSNYNDLTNKPQIGEITLSGNKTASDLGLATASHTHTKSQITDFPATMTPSAHKSSHATDGSDAITPADIGAMAANVTHLSGDVPTSRTINNKALSADVTLGASDVGAVAANTAITGATKCKVTYDSKGLVTNGADLAASDIPDLSASYDVSGSASAAQSAAISACVKKVGELSQTVEGSLTVGAVYVGGTRVEVVSAVPASPISNTLYFVTGS